MTAQDTSKDEFLSTRAAAGWVGAAVTGFLCLFFSLSALHIMSPGLQVSDIADRDLTATATTSVVDKLETDKLKDRARQKILPVFQVDQSHDTTSIERIESELAKAESLHALGLEPVVITPAAGKLPANILPVKEQLRLLDLPEGELALDISKDPNLSPLTAQRQALVRARQAGLVEPEGQALNIALTVNKTDMPRFKSGTMATAKRMLKKFHRYPVIDRGNWLDVALEFLPEQWSAQERQMAAVVISNNLEANLVIDPEATKVKAEDIVKGLQPVKKTIKEGEVIVPRGAMISAEKLSILQELGITHVDRWPFILSMGISLVSALTLVGLFLYTYEPKHFFSPNSVGLMFTVQVVVCSVASLVGKTNPQFVPIPAAALVLTIFFGRRTALALIIPLVLLLAVDRLMDLHSLAAHTLATALAIWAYSSTSRSAVVRTGLLVAVGLVVGDLASSSFDHGFTTLSKRLFMDFAGGITSSIIAMGSLPLLENIFGLITPFRLAELTDANQPLLRRLEENAPGTYQHSLAVANMAEAGAKAIYADANMVRAGALYHDIGKMVRPKYFIENQLGATNPHDSMAPEDSRARVLAHVTDGIALAQKYALPKAIQDFIPMHQGTTLMAYFYHKACTRDGADKVDQAFYRYPGPKPNTKETAIVMLADVSEAVTHSMRDPSQEEVEEALTKVFQNRWDDGQFSDSGLSYEELQKVKAGFARVWRTLHHERLKYPATTTGKMPFAPTLTDSPTTAQAISESAPEASANAAANPADSSNNN